MHFDINTRARPVLKWAGGKASLLEQLFSHFPVRFERYIEPFLGGGAVFFSLKSGTPSIINEINPELFHLYSVIRDRPLELSRQLEFYAQHYTKDFYYQLRSENPRDPVMRAARTLFLNKTGFNGLYRQNSKGQFNVPFGHRKSCPALFQLQNLFAVSERLTQTKLLNVDFELVLAEAGQGDFVYCDPPYEPLSSTSSFNSYTGNGFNRDEQERLYRACVLAAERGAQVAVSNSFSEYILNLYARWDVRAIKARRSINSNPLRRGEINEALVLMQQPLKSSR